MPSHREKFATEVDGSVLAEIRRISEEEGRQLQSVVEEALKAHIEQHGKGQPRPYVLAAYRSSVTRYAALYEKLPK